MASVSKREWVSPNGEKKVAWVLRYTDPAGKRRLKTFERKKEADGERVRIEAELAAGTHCAHDKTVTIGRVASEFEDFTEERFKAGVIGLGYLTNVRMGIRKSILPQLGHIALADLSVAAIEDLFRAMTQQQKLAARTAMERKRILVALESFAVRRGYTQRRIVEDAAKGFPFGTTKPIRVPSKDDIGRLLMVVNQRPHWGRRRTMLFRKLYVHLATFCGLRFGEIGGLTRKSVDFDAGLIRVRSSVTKWREVKRPKTEAGVRDVPLPPHLVADLKLWLERYFVENSDDLLLTTPAGQTIVGPDWHRHHWKDLLERAELTTDPKNRLHFHALRHFAGSWWLGNGLDVPLVSHLLGHANPAITMKVYAHTLQTVSESQVRVVAASARLLAAS